MRIGFTERALLSTLLVGVLCSAPFAQDETKPEKKPGTIAVFDLSKTITDQPAPDDPLFGTIGAESLLALTTRIEKAAEDSDVAAVVLLMGGEGVPMGQIEEIRQAVDRVKANKPVYAHADSLTTGTYALMAGATRLSVSPTGDAWVNGIYGEKVYIRGLLDLLGVEPDFLTCGSYKSAAEMFMRTSASEESAEMTKWLYDSLFEALKDRIASGRNVDVAKVDEWIDQGIYSATSAQAAGLTDAVETLDDLTNTIKKEHGAVLTFDKSYGKKTGPNLDMNNPFAAFQLWGQILSGPSQRRSTKDAIAVVYIDGPIMLGKSEPSAFGATEGAYSEPIRKAVGEVADDPRVKGIVIRVNSPGGSATASEIMLQAILRAQSKKPVVVSMGSVAASGGYYVACRADKVFANEATITGSIGVVAGKLATMKMWNRIGVNFEAVERGKKSGILKSSSPFKDEDREELQGWMDEVYGIFKGHVTSGRGEKLTKPIDDIAGGRVYSGKQALELGLIDEIGSLDDAINYLAEEVQLKEGAYEIRTVPRAENFLEQLFAELSPTKEKDDKRLSLSLWSQVAPVLEGIDPERVAMLRAAFLQLDYLQHEKVMLTIPVMKMIW